MKRQMHRILYILLAFLSIVVLIKAYSVTSVEKISSSEKQLIPVNQWEQKLLEVQGKKYGEYSCKIPEDISNELVLSVKGYYSSVTVALNQEEIYSYEDTYREKGAGWKWLELPEDAAGQLLTVRVFLYNANRVPVLDGNVYLGEKNAVFLGILKENLYALIWGGIMILTGIIICLGKVVLHRRVTTSVRKGINYLGNFILLAGVWIISDSTIMQYVTERMGLISVVSFMSFMLMPYFLLMFMGEMMFYEKRGIKILCGLHLANMTVCLFLYLFRLVPLYKTLLMVHILILISVGVVMKNAVTEIRYYKNKEIKKILVGLIALIGFGLTALGFFYQNQNSLYSVFYGAGLFVFIICLIGAAVDRLRYYLVTSANARKYQEIAYMDIMTHMENRMAFLKQQESGGEQDNRGCVVLDINDLKKANDYYGHQEGDKLIVDAAECIQTAFAGIGKCYRIGGDEFAIILHTISEEEIRLAIERLEQRMKQKNIGRKVPIKIAYGYSIQHEGVTVFQDLFNEADANMYARKQEMKNTVTTT